MGGNRMATVLVAEDDRKISQLLHTYLTQEGYQVVTSFDGEMALEMARRYHPDVVLLDVMMPGLDGFSVCRQIRRTSDVPILLLTARDEELDKLTGLEAGADDYVTKPFSPREVVARVKALLRRAQGKLVGNSVIQMSGLEIDIARHLVLKDGVAITLTPTEFRLLEAMARNPGRVFTRLQLIELVQGEAFEGYERTVDAHIKNLRRKIENDPKHPVLILTVFGVGYKSQEANHA
jgi:two-component system, OmpR family, alkaline phosphatase synthesis response regulator PhoP